MISKQKKSNLPEGLIPSFHSLDLRGGFGEQVELFLTEDVSPRTHCTKCPFLHKNVMFSSTSLDRQDILQHLSPEGYRVCTTDL